MGITAINVCAGTTVTLTASGATTYTWSGGISNGSGFVPTSTTIYSVTGSGLGVCLNTVTVSLTVNPLPTVSVTSGTICAGQAFTISPSGALTYTYSNGSSVVKPTSTTSYTVSGTDVNGCKNSAISLIKVNSVPSLSVNSGAICSGQLFTMPPT